MKGALIGGFRRPEMATSDLLYAPSENGSPGNVVIVRGGNFALC